MTASPRPRLRFSLSQLIRLVIYCAVILGCLVPMIRPGGYGRGWDQVIFLVTLEAIALPLALTACTIALVRPGPGRSIAVTSLLLCSTAAVLAYALFASWSLIEPQLAAMRSPLKVPPNLIARSIVVLLDPAIGAAFVLLASRLARLLRAGRSASPVRD
ncbi:hypothetical protein AB1L88_19910, partial [Tautonia sp. JC769]|uniref:hypothetical protein n=1 Tax=Tautonia sp. JC769 TaxID=3232135 RepID=UPI003458531E